MNTVFGNVPPVSRTARLPSSPPETTSFVALSKQCEAMTLDELWWIRTGSCQFNEEVASVGLGADRGQTTVWPSVPAVKILLGERN